MPRRKRAEAETTAEEQEARKGPSEYDLRSPRGGPGVLTFAEGSAASQHDPHLVVDPDERDEAYRERRSGFASDPEAEVANPDKSNKLAGIAAQSDDDNTPFAGNFYLPSQRTLDNDGPNPAAVVNRPYGSEPGNLDVETGRELARSRPLEEGPRQE